MGLLRALGQWLSALLAHNLVLRQSHKARCVTLRLPTAQVRFHVPEGDGHVCLRSLDEIAWV
jgi:hypothetical protein